MTACLYAARTSSAGGLARESGRRVRPLRARTAQAGLYERADSVLMRCAHEQRERACTKERNGVLARCACEQRERVRKKPKLLRPIQTAQRIRAGLGD